jgi:hypothetical protein
MKKKIKLIIGNERTIELDPATEAGKTTIAALKAGVKTVGELRDFLEFYEREFDTISTDAFIKKYTEEIGKIEADLKKLESK